MFALSSLRLKLRSNRLNFSVSENEMSYEIRQEKECASGSCTLPLWMIVVR
jgi:hypothetical protein